MSTVSTPKLPPLDGSLFLPDLINFHMRNNPTLPIWVYPNDQGITEITHLEFGRAAHRVAHALRPERTGVDGQVVMLIANTDTILYQAVVAGMSIAGLAPFPVSPRNSPAAVAHMIKKINCSRIITVHDVHQSLVDAIRQQCSDIDFAVEEIPTISYTFPNLGREVDADPFVPYPHSSSRPDLNVPAMYIHSSGSTGFPKPVPLSSKVQVHWMSHIMTAYFHKLSPSYRVGAMGLPPFHALGVTMQLLLPIGLLATVALYPPQTINDHKAVPTVPTSDNILNCARRTHCQALITVPTFLTQWVTSTKAVETLAKLDRVVYGGGPLADKIGNVLWAAGVNISIAYGGTEFGSPLCARSRAEVQHGEWMWVRFSEDIQTTENNQVAIENLADVKGYATSDLFIKHPTKNLWKIVGRADDVIVLSLGEKIVPITMEGIILTSPLLQGVVMFGRGRDYVGVLVEPRPEHAVDVLDNTAVATFRNRIWPVIEEANRIAPAFARIFKEMILIADSRQPMPRTAKGTVPRQAAIKNYEAKINSLYTDVETTYSSSGGLTGPLLWTTESVLAWLTAHASVISQGRSLDPSSDLFGQSFDSLSATYLQNRIINAFRKASDVQVRSLVSLVSPNIVFENPTLRLLAARISSIVGEQGISPSLDRQQQHVAAMDAMIQKYSAKLSEPASAVANGVTNGLVSHYSGAVVLLTGSTGGLGSLLLSQLLQHPGVERVYSLNRSSSSTSIEQRQQASFIDKGIPIDLLRSEKLVSVETDASQDRCGLSHELYEEIRDSVTIIIHNAWRLDFNLSLVSFEPNIVATRNLVDLALDAKYRRYLRFLFTSSVATARSWDHTKGPFPEELQSEPSTAVGMGYGESKYICERIIARSGLRATSLRIGQIAGCPNGSWATTNWVPIIVKSSIALGALPNSTGVVSWMRAEDVAAAVLDVAFANSAPQSLNIVNPRRARWSDVMSSIRNAILERKSWQQDRLTIVPFAEWVARIEKKASSPSSEDLAHIPALKLVEFFRDMARLDDELARTHSRGSDYEAGGTVDFNTTEAQRVSDVVRKMQPVGDTDVRAWIRYWITKRFL